MAATEAGRKPEPAARLAIFTAAALAIPGLSAAEGLDLKPESLGVDSAYSNYQESNGRMSVQAFQNDAALGWARDLNFKLISTLDYIGGGSNPMDQSQVGGASPVFYWGQNNLYGKNVGQLELSQATHGPFQGRTGGIHDQRLALSGSLSKKFDDLTLGVSGGNSTEWDYTSNFANIDGTWDFNQKLTTLALGLGYASDSVWADGGQQGAIHETYSNGQEIGGHKDTYQGLLGITQVLDKNSLVQLNLTVSESSGFLSDPYKSSWVNHVPGELGAANTFCRQSSHFAFAANLCADTRPGLRTQEAVLLRYVRNFPDLNAAALHADYRFYSDSWNVNSHMFEFGWIQPLPFDLVLTPHIRYYTQNSAYFYQTVYDSPTANGLYSSDYRLSSFGSVAGGVKLSKTFFDKLQLGAGVELYQRTQGMGFLGGDGTAQDNFNFVMYSLTLNLRM